MYLKCANVTTMQTILHAVRTKQACDCDVNNSTSIGLLPFHLPRYMT